MYLKVIPIYLDIYFIVVWYRSANDLPLILSPSYSNLVASDLAVYSDCDTERNNHLIRKLNLLVTLNNAGGNVNYILCFAAIAPLFPFHIETHVRSPNLFNGVLNLLQM